ncbi:MAG: broad specificity phosphatase PhoE [Paracoccaceae bacterium]|jgi:broad specificity phosphatase PhoE
MTEILLIRHGQASFGAANYDALSDHGRQQARWLGEHFAALGVRPSRVITGSLSRQIDTAAEIRIGMGDAAQDWPEREEHAGFNEYDAELMAANWRGGGPAPAHADRRDHFRDLTKALAAWQRAEVEAEESWAAFEARTSAAMAEVSRLVEGATGPVLVATSGGVIGELIRKAVGAPPASWIKVHMQVRNGGYSRIMAGRGGLSLASFNETPHLDLRPGAVTYS